MFHPLAESLTAGIEIPAEFTNPFDYVPHPLVEIAREQLCRYIAGQTQWHEEIERGKMFGLLVVQNSEGALGFLAAFSGYLAKQTLHPYFTPPILNLLEPNGFFAIEEANISAINRAIALLEEQPNVREARRELTQIKEEGEQEIAKLKAEYATSRAAREERRARGENLEELNAESQRQKGTLRRRELHYRTLREPLEAIIRKAEQERESLIEQRQQRSAALQHLTFSRFAPLNALGERCDLVTIFKEYNNTIPPAGSGECAAPKLLHYALANSLRPIAMGEFWWGESTRSEVRRHMHYYPACRGKCHPILTYMLQGLNVIKPRVIEGEELLESQLKTIYEDDQIVVFNKPSGLPSVRGKNHTISVQSIAEERYPHLEPNNMIVHRLDMDTSGVLIIAKSAEAQISLQQQFASHTIRKRYIAIVDGIIEQQQGAIELPLALDPMDRPRQRVDYNHGKAAYTHYSVLEVEGNRTRIALYPQTGRTHQLRVHCAHSKGLATPIVGDRLYGTPETRLMLHAEQITLCHPSTNRKFTLRCTPEF